MKRAAPAKQGTSGDAPKPEVLPVDPRIAAQKARVAAENAAKKKQDEERLAIIEEEKKRRAAEVEEKRKQLLELQIARKEKV